MPLLLLLLKEAPYPTGVGLEWMPIASLVIPVVILVLVIWLGSRNTV